LCLLVSFVVQSPISLPFSLRIQESDFRYFFQNHDNTGSFSS